jgi:hypothetical protein
MSINITLTPLFDVSGNTTLFGESFGNDLISGHLTFSLDMRNDSNYPFSVTDLTDTFCIGDMDSSYNILYVKNHNSNNGNVIDLFCEKMANAIIYGKLKQITPTGNHSNDGIPIGGGALVDSIGNINSDTTLNLYHKKWLTSISPESGNGLYLGKCLERTACVHLLGHPLSQALFADEQNIHNNIAAETSTKKGDDTNNFDNTLSMQFSQAFGGSINNNSLNSGLAASGDNTTGIEKANGIYNPVLLSVYEQLINNGGRSDDISGAQTVEGTTKTTIASLPFKTGDTLTVYIRPIVKISFGGSDTQIYNSSGGLLDIPGLVTRNALKSSMNIAYPGASAGAQKAQPYKYSWMGSADNSVGISRDCTQELTNVTDPNMFDGHVWKINISL